jgi:hypothetical protein
LNLLRTVVEATAFIAAGRKQFRARRRLFLASLLPKVACQRCARVFMSARLWLG